MGASLKCHAEIYRHGILHTADLNIQERKKVAASLSDAIINGNLQWLGQLVSTDKGKACINEGDNHGRTPLHYAALYSKFEAVKLLVETGAEVDPARNAVGTPLTLAAKMGYDSIAEYLLDKGASMEKAIDHAHESEKIIVKAYFVELERIVRHRQKLEKKREELYATMMSSKEPETLPTMCKGIKIGGLRKMKAQMQSECSEGRFKEYREITTTEVVDRFVKDEKVSGDLRLIDAPGIVAPEHKAMPTLFISHAWKGRFSVLLEEIFSYADKNGLSDETAVWIDVFCVNQTAKEQNQADVAAFKDVVQNCIEGTLVVCDFDRCEAQSRAW